MIGRTALVATLLACSLAQAVTLPGGGSKRNDCFVQLMTSGLGFPGGARAFTGTTCADGDVCDGDGVRNGVCVFTPMVCLNVADPALARCSPPAEVARIRFKGKVGRAKLDTTALDGAVAALGLPSGDAECSPPVDFAVPVGGPNKRGELLRGTAKVRARAKTTKGADKDRFAFVCLPAVGPQPTTTTTTTSTLPAGPPGAGLQAEIVAAAIDAGGQVVVTFRLTDAAGVAVVPRTGSTSNPNEARVRFTIARLETDAQTVEGFTTTFTRYVNYITGSEASGSQPGYDTTGAFALVDAQAGTWTYAFGRMLPAGIPATLTHTLGAQVERAFQAETLVENPTFDFVPAGGPVTTVRENTTTAECNDCHNPLAEHGGGRREVKHCQLCHTAQAVDPQTGNEIDFKHMVHRIHRGKDLPSVADGAVGAKYSIIGFGDSELTFSEKVKACAGGPFESAPCETDFDCGGGTCSGSTVVGVGFPQDVRNCTKCHAAGVTASNHRTLPSTLACTGCHDDVNPGEAAFHGLPPGEGHLAGPQPEAFCRICHKEAADEEFDITVPGAHVIPTRSATLPGLQAEILAASGVPSAPVQVQFRLRDGAGSPLTTFTGLNLVRFVIAGPTRDYAVTPTTATAFGGGATGTLTGPDGTGLATYTTNANLPADAEGTWSVGLEARRNVTVNGASVGDVAQNPVAHFSVDGSPVAARRTIVTDEKCASCHGTFSKDFSVHGGIRNRVEHCALCHNPTQTDFARRRNAIANGADPVNESISLEHLLHKVHRGEALEGKPYVVYGFGSAPANYTAHDFGDILFPGDLRDCETCHGDGSHLLPLLANLLPTVRSVVNAGAEQVTGSIPPVQDACLSCHDSAAAAAHAETNTTGSGAEACAVCHGEGSAEAVSVVHATDP